METVRQINACVEEIAREAKARNSGSLKPAFVGRVNWPADCTVGPGLEGAIACESKVGYVNGSQGALLYRGYDVLDLCAHSTFEEVSYLLIHGRLPSGKALSAFHRRLSDHRHVPETLRRLMGFPVEDMHAMAALRLGTNLMRQDFTEVDHLASKPDIREAIATDEDSVPMETMPFGEQTAVYEFGKSQSAKSAMRRARTDVTSVGSCYHLIAGVATIAAAISRMRNKQMPLEPDPNLGHAANYLYMITGKRPTPAQERIMDICLILHADHGMNASTFAAIVVASTLSDMYASIGSGIAALTGPLHGGANEQVVKTLLKIGGPRKAAQWCNAELDRGRKIVGFGHRVYKTYDPRALVLRPLAKSLAELHPDTRDLYKTAVALESAVIRRLGKEKGIYPNVDFYSGLVYRALGISPELFTPTFAVSRVSGWTARVLEYLQNNRIFRPRAIYTGSLNKEFTPLAERDTHASRRMSKQPRRT